MIKVLIVEDSPVIRDFLKSILSSDPEINVVGTASNGEEGIEAVKKLKPDVITMDIHMPVMDGFEATRIIMETHPTPIVIVSGTARAKEVSITFKAMEVGALTVFPRPQGIGQPDYDRTCKELIKTVKLMSEVRVVTRWSGLKKKTISPSPKVVIGRVLPEIKIVAIGASTGGPMALQSMISKLNSDFPVPLLIVQHMAAGFVEGFAEWLSQSTNFPVTVATYGEHALPGHAYLAPDGTHMMIRHGAIISMGKGETKDGPCPSVSCLFESVADVFQQNAIGILLTGMGQDGVAELKLMRDRGAITMVQDEKSSVVFGMPGEAIKIDAAEYVLPPYKIGALLVSIISN